MAAEQVAKTAYYLRARRGGLPFDLQAMILSARKKKKTVADSEVTLGGGDVVRIQHYTTASGQTFLHLARYIPGVEAATLLPQATSEEDDEGAQPAPKGKEFKEGDCFLLVKEHHVLYCGHGISKEKASLYLQLFFNAAKLHEKTKGFDLTPASKLDKLSLIQTHGVRSIELETTAFAVSIPKAKRNKWIARALGALSDEFKAMVQKDQSTLEQKALEDLIVNVEVRLDGNTRAAQSAQRFIEEVGESVLEDTEAPISDFAIITQNNERITSNDIRLQARVKVDTKGNSVSHNSAWSELGKYFQEISQGKLLEQ